MIPSQLPKYLAIEGPIGVGKTSLAEKIAREFQYELCLEKPDDNPFLKDFYLDSEKHAFTTQIHFVMQRSQQINKYFSDELIDKKIISDFIFQKEDLFAKLNLSTAEYETFLSIKSKFYNSYPKPDLVIYLQASPKSIFEKIKARGKDYEEKLSFNYLQRVCEMYTDFFFDYSNSPLLVLNVDDIDFVSNQKDYETLINHLKREIVGKEYINLSPQIF